MMIQLIRHATLLLDIQGKKVLLDPMLSRAGAMAAVPDVPNPSNNPLVDLPVSPSTFIDVDAVLLTHNHRDHFDAKAIELLSKDIRIFCQPEDEKILAEAGFKMVQPVKDSVIWEGIAISRTSGQHGTGQIGKKMGPVSGFVLAANDEPILYICGDTIWCPEVEKALAEYQPRAIVANAGGARFAAGGSITMDKQDLYQLCEASPEATVIAVHMEAWNHCSLTREELKKFADENGLSNQLVIPRDGERLSLN